MNSLFTLKILCMKKHFTLSLLAGAVALMEPAHAQIVPVAVTGFNLDAVAESSPASASTTGSLDGSNYVLYSAAYGTYFGTGTGLPNSGTISSGQRNYQMEPFSQNNVLYITAGLTDSLMLNTPASFSAVSLLSFGTEGTATVDVTLKFTDGTSAVYTGKSLPDWFNSGGFYSGFDRTGRNTNTPDYNTSQPSMFATDLQLACANQSKSLDRIVFHNTGTNARACIFALSGAATPVYTTSFTQPTCNGGTNGTATITVSGGLAPFAYSWGTTPAQTTTTVTGLSAGTYTVSGHDATNCPLVSTVTVTQPAPGTINISGPSAICIGSSASFTASGASTYTWSNNANTSVTAVTPTATSTYSVSGKTAANCFVTGSVTINVNPLPVISFSVSANALCHEGPAVALHATPNGGTYTGPGLSGAGFDPYLVSPGTYTLNYFYTDANGCYNSSAASVTVTSCLGVEELSAQGASAYPNPNTGSITIKLSQPGDASIDIYDALGNLVMTQALSGQETTISTASLQSGVYYYTIRRDGAILGHAKMIRQ